MDAVGVRRVLALVVATVAMLCGSVALGTSSAGAADLPPTGSCESQTALVRLLQPGPSCSVTVQCPTDSVGCAFSASAVAQSALTIGTAQGALYLSSPDHGETTTFGCSAPAALIASGPAAGCTAGPFTSFMPAGSRFTATCVFVGATVSINAKISCAAGFAAFGEG